MTARTLVLMRHAKSDWSHDVPDLERPIGGRGRRQAGEAGEWLSAHVGALDAVLTSPARRALETWECVAAAHDGWTGATSDARLYTWRAEDMLAALHDLDDEVRVALLVGHNPGLDDLVVELTGVGVPMVTSALAVLTFDGSWRGLLAGGCRLTASGRPPS